MAKGLFVCYRTKEFKDPTKFSRELSKRLAPDNAFVNDPYVSFDRSTFSTIYAPVPAIEKDNYSFCLGIADKTKEEGLFEVGSELPEGSFALFRANENYAEVVSDFASSRTIWYYYDDEKFIASTSQRMIVGFLGNLEFSNKAAGFNIATGTLGPGYSWDKRIKMVRPRTCIKLDRQNWDLSTTTNKFDFTFTEDTSTSDKIHEDRLAKAVKDVTGRLKIRPSEWTIALSGGMDSRSILYHYNHKDLEAVTWGDSKALNYKSSDAHIAKVLADKCGMKHEYANMDFEPGSFDVLIERFIGSGEGRIDHLGGYFDGMKIWSKLSKNKRNIIRGYDAFGRKPPVANDFQVRRANNLGITEDIGLEVPEKFVVTLDDVPDYLKKKEGEVLEDWRDRLWLLHRTPIVTAALEDIKLAYVEIINPLLTEEIVSSIQQLPIHLRNDKKVWFNIVSKMFPGTPFATRDAIQEVSEVLNLPEVREAICSYLKKKNDGNVFPQEFITFLIENFNTHQQRNSFRRKIRKYVKAYSPLWLENMVRRRLTPSPKSHQLIAIRVYTVLKMKEFLDGDAQVHQYLT